MESEETKNELALTGVNELQAGMFSGNKKVKKATSLNLENEVESDMLLNGMQDCNYKLNECIGKEIEVIGCYATERDHETFNDATGESVTFKKHTLMLFDVNGESYVTGSNSCYMSFMDIVAIKGMPTSDHHLFLTPVKVDAKEKGHTYLKLKLVTKKK